MATDFEMSSPEGIMRQSEVVAMRALTDQMKMVVESVTGLRTDIKDVGRGLADVRERLVKVESSNWQAALDREVLRVNQAFLANSAERARVMEESSKDRRRIEDKFDKAIKEKDEAFNALSDKFSNLTGRLLPLATVGLLILSAVIAAVIKVIH